MRTADDPLILCSRCVGRGNSVCGKCGCASTGIDLSDVGKAKDRKNVAISLCMIVAGVLGVLLVLASISKRDGPRKRLHDTATITMAAYCAESESHAIDAYLAIGRGDNAVVLELLGRGRLHAVAKGDAVRVDREGKPLTRVRVITGLKVGLRCFFPTGLLSADAVDANAGPRP